jgi:hypothetical protein
MRRARILSPACQAFYKAPVRLAKIFAVGSLCCVLADCGIGNNSCVSFVWNPGGIDSPNPSCPFTQGNGTVNVQINSSIARAAGPTSPNLQHVYVTLTGIGARTGTMAGQSSPAWQELAPELAANPRQVDLLENSGDACASHSIARSEIPGGVYTEIRLRLGADDAPAGDPSGDGAGAEENACAGVGRNCVVTTRGEIRPLILDGAAPDLIIGSKELDGGFLRVLPDQENNLSIEFNPYASLAMPAGDGVKIIPQFSASTGDACVSNSAGQLDGKTY